jgi:DNA primase
MYDKQQLLELLQELLGSYIEFKKHNEVAFYCPMCGHHKRKLQVNTVTGKYHCWICEAYNRTAGNSFMSLFKRMGATKDQCYRLSQLVGQGIRPTDDLPNIEERRVLPSEFISLSIPSKSFDYKNALAYVTKRGITMDDVVKYNIGYATRGRYSGKIIIPSYDQNGQLNFFIGRAFYHRDSIRHLMPEWSKDTIIGFELFVNWDMPIIIVEGAFDAIAAKVNAIPLFGKTVSSSLHKRIIERQTKDIYLSLDKDAVLNSARYIELFLGEGRNVYFVELEEKDPSTIGFEGMQHLIRNAKRATFADTMRLKLL